MNFPGSETMTVSTGRRNPTAKDTADPPRDYDIVVAKSAPFVSEGPHIATNGQFVYPKKVVSRYER